MDSSRIADTAQQQPDRIRALEHRTIADITRPLAEALTDVQAAALTRWVRETVGQQIPSRLQEFIDWVRRLIRQAFAGKGKQAREAVELAALVAAQQGVQQASQLASAMSGQPAPVIRPEPGQQAQDASAAIPPAVEEEQSHALAMLTVAGLTATGLAGLNSVFKRARRAVGRISRGTAVAITAASAHAVGLVARAFGSDARLLWVTETGACPACRAYAGLTVKPGHLFPGGLSLDPRRTVFADPIPGPPRHVHC